MSGNIKQERERLVGLFNEALASGGNGNQNIWYLDASGKKVVASTSTTCAGDMIRSYVRGSKAIGASANDWSTKLAQAYLHWQMSPRGYYGPLVRHLGQDFHVIKKNDKITAMAVLDTNINLWLLHNFVKSWRTVSEHKKNLELWYRLVKDGGNPGVAWLVSFNYNLDGSPKQSNHSPIETYGHDQNGVSLIRFVDPFHKEWDKIMTEDVHFKNTKSYATENAVAHSPHKGEKHKPFFVHKDIPRFRAGVDMQTYFIKKYHLAALKSKGYSYEELLAFCKNARELC